MTFTQVGMIGVGSMGSMMSLLFNEHGFEVHFYDPAEPKVQKLLSDAKKINAKVHCHKSQESLCSALKPPRLIVFSLPHGEPIDSTIDALLPHVQKGDVLIDAANEEWERTERRQAHLSPHGIHFIGMGVSGGYQSARNGPSCSPGGSDEALTLVMPFLQKVAARDRAGNACVTKVGPGGSGHYVKSVHNGIEQGMLSTICEAWALMRQGMSMSNEEIGAVFDEWNTKGPLRGNFLLAIGSQICRTVDADGHVLDRIKDKVVQDADSSEGTGWWTLEAAADAHVDVATIAAAHNFRLSSAYRSKRETVQKACRKDGLPKPFLGTLDELQSSVYLSVLAAFMQGMHLIARASRRNDWNVHMPSVLAIWRAGCIIQSDFIVEDLLPKVYADQTDPENVASNPRVASNVCNHYNALKSVVSTAIDIDAHVPSLAASLEYLKYIRSTNLPTQFMEAEMDYFGEHNFERTDEKDPDATKGRHHHEWKPAVGIHGD